MPLGGSPLNVYVGERGQLQAFRAPNPDGIYQDADSDDDGHSARRLGQRQKTKATRTVKLAKLKKSKAHRKG